MPWKGEKYLWTVADKLGDLLQSNYGTEREEKEADLLDLVDAARYDLAISYRERADADEKAGGAGDPRYREILRDLASELDPDTV